MIDLLPLFMNLSGRRVVLVGAGPVAAAKLTQLLAARADVLVVAPEVHPDFERAGVAIARREFVASDLDGAWLVVAAAPPPVNRAVAAAAEARRVFVNAVDDPSNATAFLSGVVRRDGVTLAISTGGDAPGLTALVREALDAVLPRDLGVWMREARRQRAVWRRHRVPTAARRPLLLEALNRLYERGRPENLNRNHLSATARDVARHSTVAIDGALDLSAATRDLSVVTKDLSVCDKRPECCDKRPERCDKGGSPVMTGHVSLVGAGPGDPGLLTRLAVARLRAANLVLYDALVDERVLRLARRAQCFFVGKRAGRHALSQAEIHTVMIRAARRGRRVVRLKGGDPFVFGRGGEEALALRSAGVPFEVVPGVTNAVAAPALAGIPVTHRGLASAFLVVSGHDEDAFDASVGCLTPERVTLVILMGYRRRSALARRLAERGWPSRMPAAIVAGSSWPQQQVWRGTLHDLASDNVQMDGDDPAVIVVGEVAALSLMAGDRAVDSHVGPEPGRATTVSRR